MLDWCLEVVFLHLPHSIFAQAPTRTPMYHLHLLLESMEQRDLGFFLGTGSDALGASFAVPSERETLPPRWEMAWRRVGASFALMMALFVLLQQARPPREV